jgi:replicative DNA helicase
METKQFGFSDELEKRLIYCVLYVDKFYLSISDYVRKEYFERSESQLIYTMVSEYFAHYKTVFDNATFLYLLKRYTETYSKEQKMFLVDYIRQVASLTITTDHVEFLKNECLVFCKRQAYNNALMNSIALVDAGKFDDIDTLIKQASMVGDINEHEIDYFDDPLKRIKTNDTDGSVIPTGLQTLNDVALFGGWNYQSHPLTMILAPSGVGKSMSLCFFGAVAISNNYTVIHYTFELSAKLTASRYDASITKIPIDERYKYPELIAKEINQFIAEKEKKKLLYIVEYPTGTCTANMLRADLAKRRDNGIRPDLVIVDYLDIMKSSDSTVRGDNTYIAQQKISEELRALASEIKAPILTATQTNRTGLQQQKKQEKIETDSMGDSWGKVKTADLIVTISLKSGASAEGNVDTADKAMSLAERLKLKESAMTAPLDTAKKTHDDAYMYIAKNRARKTGIGFDIVIDYACMRLCEASAWALEHHDVDVRELDHLQQQALDLLRYEKMSKITSVTAENEKISHNSPVSIPEPVVSTPEVKEIAYTNIDSSDMGAFATLTPPSGLASLIVPPATENIIQPEKHATNTVTAVTPTTSKHDIFTQSTSRASIFKNI